MPVLGVQWQDVTRECIWREGQYLYHGETQIGRLFAPYSDTYRVRQGSLWQELPQSMRDILAAQTTFPHLIEQLQRSVSFLIERQVED